MIDYLTETYNGNNENMLVNSAYYCYTIKDSISGKYYSGSRGIEGSNKHDLLTRYFTSSTVVDFKSRLMDNPEEFTYRVEYFPSRREAFIAEKIFHEKHNVGRNKLFLNSINSGGSNCGAGSVLCRSENGKIYRVSVEEYKTGKHFHVSSGMMNIRTENGKKKIKVSEFNPEIHTSEFYGYVLVKDTKTGKNRKIPKEQFLNDDRFVGITTGMVAVIDKVTNKTCIIEKTLFDENRDRYTGVTTGLTTVIDKETGKKVTINVADFDKDKYIHPNKNMVKVYSISKKTNVNITVDEYKKNIDDYANLATKILFEVDGILFKSKKSLDQYYKLTRGISVLKYSQYSISEKYPDIRSITREEHAATKN